ncbi:hypothetical protein [Pseudobdellovibrio sp. HCB154]|uniref:hypothetical protein n=1 Tax=Pseudobdellovibrio sp. HCB154 TaxID=3386277 RepID=UPI003916F470
MFKFIKRFVVIIASFYSAHVFADAQPACYSFTVPEGPEADAAVVETKETWCYQQLSSPMGTLYVFNVDAEKVVPELAFTMDPDGVMTHGSLKQGVRSVHKVLAKDFNPFSIPYNEPKHMKAEVPQYLDQQLMSSANETLRVLSTSTAPVEKIVDLESLEMDTGEITEESDIKPWRGYWWAYNGRRLSNGSNSPMAKYDRFVKARTGSNPGSQAWENSRHRYHGINWEGHCNGWAASSVLRAEPSASKYDDQSNTTFSVSDQKGLLAETDYCVKIAFFGNRYRGSNSNPRDIGAALFHKTLRYYIGTLKKPIAVDYKQLEPVDNHVISGYTMKIKQTGARTYAVTAKVRIHKYDKSPSSDPGEAPSYIRTYSYRLTEASDGSLTGSWTSSNPDFLWVPLASVDCNNNNPRINHDRIQEMLDLPVVMSR